MSSTRNVPPLCIVVVLGPLHSLETYCITLYAKLTGTFYIPIKTSHERHGFSNNVNTTVCSIVRLGYQQREQKARVTSPLWGESIGKWWIPLFSRIVSNLPLIYPQWEFHWDVFVPCDAEANILQECES